MTIGITGASGHVGANLTRTLLARNYKVRVLEHDDQRGIEGLDVEIVKGGLDNRESLDRFCQGIDVMFHLAAKISIGNDAYELLHKVNVEGTQNIVNSCKKNGIKRFIYFSTIHVLDHNPLNTPVDEHRPMITNSPQAYERTKSIVEKWIISEQTENFQVVILNPTAIIGPCDYKPSLMGQLLIKLYRGHMPFLVPDGYNWVDVRDVAEAAANAITKGRGGERYILSGHWKSLKDIGKTMEQVTGKRIKNIILPYWMAYMGVPFAKLWSAVSGKEPLYTKESLDIVRLANKNILHEKAGKELEFTPHPFSDTIKDTVEWFKENNYI